MKSEPWILNLGTFLNNQIGQFSFGILWGMGLGVLAIRTQANNQ